ncbi:hypothetical protein AAII07_11130 [Microvirga sp. 0TCS3.31]
MGRQLDLTDVQANILHSYGHDPGRAAYFLLRFDSPRGGRRFLSDLLPDVTPATSRRPSAGTTVSITHAGFGALGIRTSLLDGFPEPFRAMSHARTAHARARSLGDVGASDPTLWEERMGTGTGQVHAIVTLHATPDEYVRTCPNLEAVLAKADDVAIVAVQEAETLRHMVEHFGFADGASQPAVEGVVRADDPLVRGGGVPLRDGGWRPVQPGEFILGYRDEDGAVPLAPDPALVRSGSYVVWRKLSQRVGAFRARLQAAAEQADLPVELMAAKTVGRWRDGLPLELDPWRSVTHDLNDDAASTPPNDFRYLPHDRAGEICPRGAHIRRTNPRDSIEFGTAVPETGLLTARHRIIRRGLPYGRPLPTEASGDDEVDRGLVFVCFQADIERQFEVIQRAWCCDGDAFYLGEDQDFLLGNENASGKMVIPVRDGPPRFVTTEPDLVVTRGMEYLFAPGLAALRGLADGRFS